MKVLLFVWKMAEGEHKKMLATSLISVLSAVLPAAIAYFIKTYIDSNALNFTNILNKEDLTLFFSLIICGIFLKMFSQLIMGYTMPNIKRNIEINCIRKISVLPHRYIVDSVDNRALMALSIESGMIANLVPMVYRSFIKAPVTIAGFIVLLLFVSPLLTLICVVLTGSIIGGVLLFRKTTKKLNRKMYDRIADLHQYFTEWLSGYKVFITSNATRFIEKQLTGVASESAALSREAAKIKAFQTLIIETLTILVTILFVWIAASPVVSGKASSHMGELLLFPTAILFIRSEILSIIYGYMQLAGTESAAKRIIDIIDYPLNKPGGTAILHETIERLSFENVSFSYNQTSDKILDSVNITWQKGEVNTIIGRSGAGKSTLLSLCMRLYLPDEGVIYYNGQDINSITEESLFSRIALVEQEPFLFEGTLMENICFDKKPDITLLLTLLRQFDLSYLAGNEEELRNTMIGPGNRQLSVGEKQRIAIIRALIKDAGIIFFDEVTGNLDHTNAAKIIDYICRIAKEKLVVCVSHDVMLIRNSTRLYEIVNGHIAYV